MGLCQFHGDVSSMRNTYRIVPCIPIVCLAQGRVTFTFYLLASLFPTYSPVAHVLPRSLSSLPEVGCGGVLLQIPVHVALPKNGAAYGVESHCSLMSQRMQ